MKGLKNVRLKNYDYKSDGYYFITAVSRNREKILADKKELIEKELLDLESKTHGLKLDYFAIMPNHIHAILVLENSKLSLGEIVRRLKAKVSHRLGYNAWQPNYYEHVIRNDNALNKIREYIINNPEAELLKFEQFY